MNMDLSNELKEKIKTAEHDGGILAKIKINCNEQYEQSIDVLKKIKLQIKELEDERKKITAPLDATKKAVMDLFRKPLTALEGAEEIIKRSAFAFVQKQEQARLDEEKKLRDKAEMERLMLEEEIAKNQAKGIETVNLEEKKADIITPTLQSNVTKISGTFVKKTWRAKVVDFSKLPDLYKLPNDKLLNSFAVETKGAGEIAGIEFYQEEQLISRI